MLGEDLDQHHIAFKNPALDQYADKLNKAIFLCNNYYTSISNLTFNSKTVETVTKLP